MSSVSVIMTAFNSEKYIKEAIDSILNQTFQDFELILVNDGSIDKTAEIMNKYKNDKRVKIFHKDKNEGVAGAANFGIAKASGEYIARLDSDDIAMKDRLEKQVKYLDTHPEVGLLGSYFHICNFNCGYIMHSIVIPTTNKELQEIILQYNQFGHSTIMIRKSVLDQVGGYNENFETAEDYDLWLRLSEITKIANLPEFLVIYRVHPEQLTNKKRKQNDLDAIEAKRQMRERRAVK